MVSLVCVDLNGEDVSKQNNTDLTREKSIMEFQNKQIIEQFEK